MVMAQPVLRTIACLSAVAVCLAVAPAAHGATLYVASNGSDFNVPTPCGEQANPCRSISRAIANAAPGDQITVGPGRYGDLDGDGVLGGFGEEVGIVGPFVCDCVLPIHKPLTVISSHGAAATIIDGRTASAARNVMILTPDLVFGTPGHGFTVTHTRVFTGDGIFMPDSGTPTTVSIRGNQVLASWPVDSAAPDETVFLGHGIELSPLSGPVLVEGNQVSGWLFGIVAPGAGQLVSKNHVAVNSDIGIIAEGGARVVGNVVTAHPGRGIDLTGGASATGNDVIANGEVGIFAEAPFSGVVEQNNIYGNLGCGLQIPSLSGGVAENNYWGRTTPPTVCTESCGSDGDDICTSPGNAGPDRFATKPFKVKPALKP
jgi:hypothetical protein